MNVVSTSSTAAKVTAPRVRTSMERHIPEYDWDVFFCIYMPFGSGDLTFRNPS